MRARSLVLAGGLLLACACSRSLDTAGLESQLQAGLQERLGITVSSVTCPDDVEAKADVSFQCTAVGESGSTTTISVTQEDDQGNVNWEIVDAT
jgi:Domain of unknown function (DUF4333)